MKRDKKQLFCIITTSLIFCGFFFSSVFANGLRNRTEGPYSHQRLLEHEAELLQGLSEEERIWYERFQEGLLVFDGWNSITSDLLVLFPEDEVVERHAFMKRLGMKIGIEWAKDNDRRKIDNDMLEAWGERIRDAKRQGPETTLALLKAIEQEVDVILERKESVAVTSR